MMLRLTGLLLTIQLTFIAKAGDSTRVDSYLGIYAGGTNNHGLSAFNMSLTNQGIKNLPTTNFSAGVMASFQFNRSTIALDANYESLQNGAADSETRVLMNCIGISANYGFDLLENNKHMRLEPFIGGGISDLQFFVFSHDSTATLNEIANGAQNLYYEHPAMGLILDGGLRFDWYPVKMNLNFGLFGKVNYQMQVNRYVWTIDEMPLDQLSKLHFSVGIKFKIKD